jgi:hypothetical protein
MINAYSSQMATSALLASPPLGSMPHMMANKYRMCQPQLQINIENVVFGSYDGKLQINVKLSISSNYMYCISQPHHTQSKGAVYIWSLVSGPIV